MASSPRHLFFLLLLPLLARAKPVLEDGYTVTTFADLNPLPASGPHPYAILPRPRAGDLILLDSAGSALYTLSLSSSPGEPRRLAGGKRDARFDDGGPDDAAFDRPRSVAVDAADNVYVADRLHGAVRKEASINHFFSRIQKQFLMTQRKATLISFCDIKSAVASSMAYTLLLRLIRLGCGYITVVFPSVRLQQEVPLRPSRRRPELRKTSTAPNIGLNSKALVPPTGLLEDLISFAGDAGDKEGNANSQEGKVASYEGDLMGLLYTPPDSVKKIDHMIETNLSGFSSDKRRTITVSGCSVSRRVHGDK